MTEKCTKTSSPVERWMNPYPFAPLNHFTVPFSLTEKTPFASALRINSLPLSGQRLDRRRHALQKNGRPRLRCFLPPSTERQPGLVQVNGTALSRNEHRIIGTIKTIRKKNEKKQQEI